MGRAAYRLTYQSLSQAENHCIIFFARNIVGKIFQDENENDIVTNKSNHKTIKPVFQLWRTSIISKTIEPTELSALPGNTHAQFWRLAPVPLRSPAARGTGTSLRRDFKQWGRYENVLSTLIKHLHCTPLISINNRDQCCTPTNNHRANKYRANKWKRRCRRLS